jgi:hypothetical protein
LSLETQRVSGSLGFPQIARMGGVRPIPEDGHESGL